MESDSGKVRILSFDAETFGQPQSWVVHHRGLEYTGEVIVAETVDPAWGQTLPRELCFRVVFYTVPRRIPSDRIQDQRIAMAVPRRAFNEVWQSLGLELRSIHEVRERYLTAGDDGALGVRQSMEDRETILRDEMTRRYATAYAEGRVYTQPHINLNAGNLFVEDAPESWADRMVAALLGLAHARPPL